METASYDCAFCGEPNEVAIDPDGGRRQVFTEDCTVCCRPNLVSATFTPDGELRLDITQE